MKNPDFPADERAAGGEEERALAGVRDRYRREAGRYDRRWGRYLAATIGATAEALGPLPGARLLDVGCGSGLLLERVLVARGRALAVGVDASPEMLRLARRRLGGRAALCAGDVHALPFAGAAFDVLASSSSLHYWAKPERALAELARVVRPGGYLVLTDWDAAHPPLRLLGGVLARLDASHGRALRASEIEALLEGAGFGVEGRRRYRVGWLWGLVTLVARRR